MRSISLPQFEGPLDLLLSLVRQNQFDLSNLPLAEITRQFLEYVAAAEKLDLDLDSEWFYMAAVLIHLKSRGLLPVDPTAANPARDPQNDFVRQLLDREQLIQAAEFLKQQWTKTSIGPIPPPSNSPGIIEPPPDTRGSLTLFEVLELVQKAQTSISATRELAIPAASVEIEEVTALLNRKLAVLPPGSRLNLMPLWTALPSDAHRSALLLGLLEDIRNGCLDYEQNSCFGPITIWRVNPEPRVSL